MIKHLLSAIVYAIAYALPAHADNGYDLTSLTNLFIGTGAHGHTHPAAVVPHGMIQPGPDTRWNGWDACSGYHYADSTLNGFALTRLSGTGCADFGDFLFMPFTGDIDLNDAEIRLDGLQQMPWASPFSHNEESARPGYYAVHLKRYAIQAEMTATERAAMFRFTFPYGQEASLLLDLDYAIQEQTTLECGAELPDRHTLRAYRRSYWWAYDQRAFIEARFSRPVVESTVIRDTVSVKGQKVARNKILLRFGDMNNEPLLVRVGLSAVDTEGAVRNLTAEMPHFDFERVRRAAKEKWQTELSRIEVKTSGLPADTIFYTALYHTALAPMVFSDVDGRRRGMDMKIHQGRKDEPDFTVFSLWDTFRALHPLVSLTRPQENAAYVRSLLRKAAEGGIVPKWECAANYTACMPGYHFASLAADAVAKDTQDFDLQAALDACLKAAVADTSGLAPCIPKYKIHDLLPAARRDKNALGYIPCDRHNESVARALEYAYDDWCTARLAERAGDRRTRRKYDRMAKAYRHYFDTRTGFMRGRDSRNRWRTPFDPFRSEHRSDDYCEGTAWQWSWFVPHDVAGLMRLMGGRRTFAARLDNLFTAPSELRGNVVSADITGLIGQYAHGNEPGHHIPYLYNYAGRHDRTQMIVNTILQTLYANAPDGLAGNEDCGQMSAWYVLSALGLYQVCPGKAEWTVGRPLFSEATVLLPLGKRLVVRAIPCPETSRHAPRIRFNGKRLRRPFIAHRELMEGGVLEVEVL